MRKLPKAIAGISAAAVLAFTGTAPSFSAMNSNPTANAAVDGNNDDWLHAEGSRLYDMNGNEVWLTGANWFGFNCSERCAHYLWSGDCDDMLREVADRGINVLRLPVSTELLYEWQNGLAKPVSGGGLQAAYNPPVDQVGEDGTITKAGTYGSINKDFVEADGKTNVTTERAFEIILEKCKHYGIKVFIDVHSPHADNSGHNYNLWYGKEMNDHGITVTTDMWIDTLVWVADKFKNDDTLLGFDLKNEPHGKGQEGDAAAKWDGSTDENNWAYAATTCADAILDVNPNALIFIEGVEQSLSGAQAGDYWGIADRRDNSPYIGAWWGGNFRGAREYPITPKHGTSQIVYSPHDYGPSVWPQDWFYLDTDPTGGLFNTQTLLDDYWYETWAYINAEDIAPELIGEWGGYMDNVANLKWMKLLRDYMIDHHINHTFWCLNTNSGDTGGLWTGFSYSIGDVTDTSNGTTITWEEEKYALMEEALWQTLDSGKYIGLDHQIPLGINGTGLSLNEFYSSYASTEGSNLDGGKKANGEPVVVEPTSTTTTTKPAETTSAATTTTSKVTETTSFRTETTTAAVTSTTSAADITGSTTGSSDKTVAGDANEDGNINMADAVFIMQCNANPAEYKLTEQGKKNADVCGKGDGVTNNDALTIQQFEAGIVKALPVD